MMIDVKLYAYLTPHNDKPVVTTQCMANTPEMLLLREANYRMEILPFDPTELRLNSIAEQAAKNEQRYLAEQQRLLELTEQLSAN